MLDALLVEHAGVVVEAGAAFLVIVDEADLAADHLDEPDRGRVGVAEVPGGVDGHHAVDRHDADALCLAGEAQLRGVEGAEHRGLERAEVFLLVERAALVDAELRHVFALLEPRAARA